MQKKIISLFVLLLLFFVMGCSETSSNDSNSSGNEISKNGDQEKVKILKLGTAAGEEAVAAYRVFESELEKLTNGSIDVEFYTGGLLGGDVQLLEGLRSGAIESALMASTPIATLDSKFNMFDIPFLFTTPEEAYAVTDGEIGQSLLKGLEEVDLVGVGYVSVVFRHLTNNVKEIRTPDDLEGLRIRTLENPLQIQLWETLGAVPQAIAFTELYSALESGVVDGQENPYVGISAAKLYEVQKYLTETAHIVTPLIHLVSKSFWDQLTAEEQEALQQAASKAIENARVSQAELDAEAVKTMEEAGVVFTKLTSEEHKLWMDKAAPMYDIYKSTIGEELFNKLMSTVKK